MSAACQLLQQNSIALQAPQHDASRSMRSVDPGKHAADPGSQSEGEQLLPFRGVCCIAVCKAQLGICIIWHLPVTCKDALRSSRQMNECQSEGSVHLSCQEWSSATALGLADTCHQLVHHSLLLVAASSSLQRCLPLQLLLLSYDAILC